MENIADCLFHRRAPHLPADARAGVLDQLIWTMDDNGREICEALRQWIASGDRARVEVALAVKEVFFYANRLEMTDAFERLCARFPELRPRCDDILAGWDRQLAARQ